MTKNLFGRNVPKWAIYAGGSLSIFMGVSGISSLILKNPALLSVFYSLSLLTISVKSIIEVITEFS